MFKSGAFLYLKIIMVILAAVRIEVFSARRTFIIAI